MAVNDIGARVKLDGERQYQEQLRQITQQTKLMRSETQQLEASFGKETTAMQKAAQQSELLKSQIAQQSQTVATAQANVERYSQATGENSSQTLKWKNVLAEAELELARLRGELAKVPNGIQIIGQRMQETGQKIQNAGKMMTSVGSTLTKSVTAPIAALGAASIKTTADFDESMSKVQALSGATGKDFDALRDKARQMGATTKYSAGESAEALSYMALAGWDTNQMLDGLDGVMNLAAASGMDLAEASDLVTDYLSAFGLEAKDSARMADQLAYAQAHSNTTTTQLGEAFGNSAAQMHTAGQSMETTTAILEAFANQGLKGSEAGTALSAMMRDITQKMKNGKIQIGDTSIAVQDQNGNFRNMVDILADVEKATEGMGSAEKSAALMTTFTARSVKGVSMALTEGTDNIYSYEAALHSADGTAKDMAETMQDNLKGQLTILKSQLQELGISFGDILVPHVRKAVEWLQGMVDKFNSLDSSTKEQIAKFAALAAAIGPVLLVGGKLTTGVGKLVEGGGKAIEWLGKMASGTVSLSGSLGPLALGLAAVAGAALAVHAGFEKIESAARDANGELYEAIDASNSATGEMSKAGNELSKAFSDANDSIETTIATGKRAEHLVDQLEDITKSHRLTADEQHRQAAIVQELNQLYPELGLEIDSTSGKLNKSVKEIRSFVENASKMAQVQAYQKAIASVVEELSDAYIAQAKAEMAAEQASAQLAASQSTLSARAQELIGKKEKLTAAEKFELGQILSGANAYTTEGQALHDATGAQVKYNAEKEKLTKTTEDAEKQVDFFQGKLDELTGGMEKAADGAEETGEAMAGMGEDTEEATDAIKNATKEIVEAYNRTKESAYDSVMGQTSLFEELEQKEATSIEKMRKGLQSHIEAYKNWNSNAATLMQSSRYQTDTNFRAIVNTIVAAGQDAAPELQALADAFRNGDAELEGLVQDYGSMSGFADTTSQFIADATTVAEYGLEGYSAAFGEGAQLAYNAMRNVFADTAPMQKTVKNSVFSLEKKTNPWFVGYGESSGAGYGAGLASSKGSIEQGYGVVETAVKDGSQKVLDQRSQAETAGQKVAGGIAAGVRAQRADINSAFTSLRTAISSGISAVQGLASSAKTAGNDVGANLAAGITSTDGNVKNASQRIVDSAKKPLSDFGSSTDPSTWGRHVGDNFANGIGGANGNATNNANKVVNAARSTLAAADNNDPWTWGRHMGDNFANGIGSAYGNVVAQANRLANAVSNILRHSTPKEGPLKDDDIWGLHLGQNFARGMMRAVPLVESAAMTMADAVALPTSTMLDIDAVSGRNVAGDALTLDGLHTVIADAVGNKEIVVQIGNREFARLLREQGAIA